MNYWLESVLVQLPCNIFRKFLMKFHTSGYIFISEYIFKGNEIIISKRNVYSHIHCINIDAAVAFCCFCKVTSVVSDSLRPHRQQLTRLSLSWDSPGKHYMDCLFFLQCLKVKSESKSEVVQDSQKPHVMQPTRLLHPWDFPGKSTGVGCHFLLHHSSLETIYIYIYIYIYMCVCVCVCVCLCVCVSVCLCVNIIQALKRKQILPFVAAWMKLEGLMLGEASQRKTYTE